VRAARSDEALPTAPDDEAWEEAEEFYFPLVAQIIVRPRWFAPSVDGVWVRALHNGDELALRLRWHDPSRSPEPRWQEWQERLLATMEPREGGPTGPQVLPDAFAVQFPRTIPEGMDRPYFLMGTAREPVYLWYWQSEPAQAYEAVARGLDRIEPIGSEHQQLQAEAVWDEGEWRLVLRRPLEPAGDRGQLAFETGRAIPIAFYAWDGDNSESGTRGAIGSWHYIWLDEPVGPGIYLTPAAAMVLTGLFGIFVVVRAQRRERLGRWPSPAARGAAAGGPSTDPHGGTHV
jgi:DMSO reductase family type II enzyme heme b subunit